jgi:hypothetical protein
MDKSPFSSDDDQSDSSNEAGVIARANPSLIPPGKKYGTIIMTMPGFLLDLPKGRLRETQFLSKS